MPKKSKKTIAIISISLILFLLGAGIYLFTSTDKLDFLKATKDGTTLEAVFYNADGNQIKSGVAQTTVSYAGRPREAGLFYMSLNIKSSNIGTAKLTNLRMTNSNPNEFTIALQNANPIKSVLEVGESNVLEWDTKNACGIDAECGSSERCINSNCLIDISNFLGEIDFTVTLEADWINAQGISDTTSTIISLPILFEQDAVIFRQSYLIGENPSLIGENPSTGDWIAIDTNDDGVLEGWGSVSSTGTSSKISGVFLGYDPEGREINFYNNKIYIYRGYTIAHNYWVFDESEPSAEISNIPLEPYLSENCGGERPCQEVYSILVAPPDQTCGNNIREGTELCDGTDLGTPAHTCQDEGFTGGTISCDSCTSWDTSLCTGGEVGEYVMFRTQTLTFDSSTAIAFDRSGESCLIGNALTKYGHEYSGHNSAECENAIYFSGGSICSSNADCLLIENLGIGYVPSTPQGDGIWKLYQDDSDVDEIWLCMNDQDGDGCLILRFDTDDCPGDCGSLSDFSESIDSSMEVSC